HHLACAPDDRRPLRQRRRRPLALGGGGRLRGPGDRRGVAAAGGAEDVARRGLDRLDRRGRVDPPVAVDLPGPPALVEESRGGRLRHRHAVAPFRAGAGDRDPMRSAAFSAIMIVAAFVLARVIVGITDASTTRSPSVPYTRSSGSTTEPIAHVEVGW